MSSSLRPIVVILGPTASGKSALGMELADRCGGEIVNADALQVYRGLDIGTAKPPSEDLQAVRHHLIDILDPEERFSAGDFARRARQAISDIQERERAAIVVGGSGLYIRALLEGISPIPPGDESVREELRQRCEAEGLAVLREELIQLDPETAERIAPSDTQRTLRGLEVALVSGRPLSEWVRERPFGESRLRALRIGLTLPRAILYDRISVRVNEMIACGWVQEVAAMLEKGIKPGVPAFQAIGYRQLVRHLEGELSLDEAIADIVRATKRYAKRQMTWFRKEEDIQWFPAGEVRGAIPSMLQDFGLLEESFSNEQT